MPRIGRRILKSSLAVFLCFVIYLLRGQEGIVFYSCIAAVLCIQQDVTNSKRVAFNRIKGTFLGGFIGMVVLLFEQSFISQDYMLIQYIIISVTIIVVIYLSVLLNMKSASYISCVVFMSITVSHAMDVNPYLFAINRMIDTLIGIFVALFINGVHLPNHHHDTSLFVVSLEHGLYNEEGQLSAYTKVKMKQLLERHANIAIMSEQSPVDVLSELKDIPLQLPLIAMNGACCYDIRKQEYQHCRYINEASMKRLLTIFQDAKINCFIHTVIHQILHVYYQDLHHAVEEEYYHRMRKTPYKNYICQDVKDMKNALMILVMEKKEKLSLLYEQLLALQDPSIRMIYKNDEEHHAYAILEIYSATACKDRIISEVMLKKAFTTLYVISEEDSCLLQMSDKRFVKSNTAVHYVKVNKKKEDGAIRMVEKCYRKRH